MKKLSPGERVMLSAYTTPIMVQILPDMDRINVELRDVFLRLRASDANWKNGSKTKSNYGGWRSGDDLWHWKSEPVQMLRQKVFREFNKFLPEVGQFSGEPHFKYESFAWANVNERGAYNSPHVHSGNHWSGVYYVAAGDYDENGYNGKITFQDPRPGAAMSPCKGFSWGTHTDITPVESMLIFFPSWLMHHVHPHSGEKPRISVPFNIKLLQK